MRFLIPVFLAGACAAAPALAQQNPATASPLESATASKVDQPVTIAKDGPTLTSDAEILRLVRMLTGNFASEPREQTPPLRYNAATIAVIGLDNAVYFEIARADNASQPFRVGIFHAYRRKGELRLRVFDLPAAPPGLREMVAGLWATPEAFPRLEVSGLTVNVDMPLRAEAENGFSGETVQPVPTTRDGAIEMTSSLRAGRDTLAFSDAGFDADGRQVWGASGGERIVFKRTASPVKAEKREDGLVIITQSPAPEGAPRLLTGGEVLVHYTGWISTGLQFDTSYKNANEPFRVRVPGPVIRGWNEGLAGIAKGERRKLIIPPDLAWGSQGRGPIVPNSTVVFDVLCVHVDNAAVAPPPEPAHVEPTAPTPHPRPTTPDADPPSAPGAPIGTPPTSGDPEKPRS